MTTATIYFFSIYSDDGVEEELEEEAASRGLQGEERDEWVLKQLEREIAYEYDVNPIVVMELEIEANQRGLTVADLTGGALGGDGRDSEATDGLTLLTLPEQIELQDTVKKLHEELKVAKKKNAQGAAMSTSFNQVPAKVQKKKKNKIGGRGHVDKGHHHTGGAFDRDGEDNDGGGTSTMRTETPTYKSKAVRKSIAVSGSDNRSAIRKSMAFANNGDGGGGNGCGGGGTTFKEKKTMRQSIVERKRAPTLSDNLGYDDMGYGGYGGGGGNFGGSGVGGGGYDDGMSSSNPMSPKDKRKSMVQSFTNPMQNMKGTKGAGQKKEPRKSKLSTLGFGGGLGEGGDNGEGRNFGRISEESSIGGGDGGGRDRSKSTVKFGLSEDGSDGGGRERSKSSVKKGGLKKSALKGYSEEEQRAAKITGIGGGSGGAGVVPTSGGRAKGFTTVLQGRVETSRAKKTEKKAAKMSVAEFEREDVL
jgi:hypothetical protein